MRTLIKTIMIVPLRLETAHRKLNTAQRMTDKLSFHNRKGSIENPPNTFKRGATRRRRPQLQVVLTAFIMEVATSTQNKIHATWSKYMLCG